MPIWFLCDIPRYQPHNKLANLRLEILIAGEDGLVDRYWRERLKSPRAFEGESETLEAFSTGEEVGIFMYLAISEFYMVRIQLKTCSLRRWRV